MEGWRPARPGASAKDLPGAEGRAGSGGPLGSSAGLLSRSPQERPWLPLPAGPSLVLLLAVLTAALPPPLALPLVVQRWLTAAAGGAKRAQLVALVTVCQGAIPRAHEALAGAARELQLSRL